MTDRETIVIWYLLYGLTVATILFGPGLLRWWRQCRAPQRNIVVTCVQVDGVIRADDITAGCELVINGEPRLPPTLVRKGDTIAIRYRAPQPLPTATIRSDLK